MKPLTAIAMSGGVDSTMAAYLLKQQEIPVIGVHFITGYEDDNDSGRCETDPPTPIEKRMAAARKRMAPISQQLGIPFEVIDIRKEFEIAVIQYFAETYLAGQTPNPCMVCNPEIKFGLLLKKAQNLGAVRMATGHYAGSHSDGDGTVHLMRGKDSKKEQSYFLARLTQKQLASAVFPLSTLTKIKVKQMAESAGISPLIGNESQDVCFIKNRAYGEFLAKKLGIHPKPGPIVDLKGNRLGVHKGLHLFTIGQRRGIDCPAEKPYYVYRLDLNENRLIVGYKADLYSSECRVRSINWIVKPPRTPVSVKTKVRYRHREAASIVTPLNETAAVVRFETPQEAITPGQCAVFYDGEEVLGGGWIERMDEHEQI